MACYNKYVKMFFGYKKRVSVSEMLLKVICNLLLFEHTRTL